MKNLTNVTLLAALFAISGCGDDQAEQTPQKEKTAKQEQAAPPAADKPVATTETTVTAPVEVSYPEPPWAVLEQNVYFYPD